MENYRKRIGAEYSFPIRNLAKNIENCEFLGCSNCLVNGGSNDDRSYGFPGIKLINCNYLTINVDQTKWKKHHTFIGFSNIIVDEEPSQSIIVHWEEIGFGNNVHQIVSLEEIMRSKI